jgi:DNA/RNA endonuclease G (NUC1)
MVSLKVAMLEIRVDHTSQLELPVGEKSYQKITRGHLASNVEMKSLGDPEEGLQAQKDSFSLANVVPQMQRHHAPIWAKLEDECLEAARRPGTKVGVISGPVYAPDVGLPPPGNEVVFTAGRDGVAVPIPTHLFKVVLARANGKRVAVGFLIPHRADLGVKDLGRFVVPVRVIEDVTGIDFMPELKANDEVETKSEARWFSGNPANVSR